MRDETGFNATEILNSCELGEDASQALRGYIDGTITAPTGMPLNATPDEIVVYRRHPTYTARRQQLVTNLLGLGGGRPYVNARLSRYAGENEIDWCGGKRPDGSRSTGRLQQTHAFPYLGRIASKINQYVFQDPPVREAADLGVVADITRDGQSVNDIMRRVSRHILAAGWCWVGVDAPARKGDGTQFSVQEKENNKIRPYWQFYSALDVLDWHFNEQGTLVWIKTQRVEHENARPDMRATHCRVVTLWELGKVTEYRVKETPDLRYQSNVRTQISKTEIPLTKSNGQPLDVVPFVLCGDTSAEPIPFDDLESINRTIMDLGSVDRANYFNTVYPQLVLPASVMARAQQDGYARSTADVARLVIGFKYPITVDKEDPSPYYLTPDASAIGSIAPRLTGLKADLFEVVGLALQQDSRQVASAEAKAWDFLDVAAVMTARAETLQAAEQKAVTISAAWDADFPTWEPVYNTDFDVGDFLQEIQAIVMAGNVSVPDEVSRMITKKLVERMNRVGSSLPQEDFDKIMDAVDNWSPNDVPKSLAFPEP